MQNRWCHPAILTPLLPLFSSMCLAQHQRHQWCGSSHQVAKVGLQPLSPSRECSGLPSFRMGWTDSGRGCTQWGSRRAAGQRRADRRALTHRNAGVVAPAPRLWWKTSHWADLGSRGLGMGHRFEWMSSPTPDTQLQNHPGRAGSHSSSHTVSTPLPEFSLPALCTHQSGAQFLGRVRPAAHAETEILFSGHGLSSQLFLLVKTLYFPLSAL